MSIEDLAPLMTSARTGDPSKDLWETPTWLYEKLDSEFHFDLDPAATEVNALSDYYYSQAQDGLVQPWWGRVFVNPPYSKMALWVEKGYNEVLNGRCEAVVLLVAARTDTRAWWNWVRHGEVRFLQGRLRFGHPDGAIHSAPFPSALAIFRKHVYEPKTIYSDLRMPKTDRRATR